MSDHDDNGLLKRAVAGYVRCVETQSTIVSTSHHYLRGMYSVYGKDRVDAELDLYFANFERQQEKQS
jgi:hypothetical protein